LRSRMTTAGRNAADRMCTWRRAIHLFSLGTAASWTSSQASPGPSPQRAFLRAEVQGPCPSDSRTEFLEPRRNELMNVVQELLFVPSGPHSATDPVRRRSGSGIPKVWRAPLALVKENDS
jgi:hypothetical protein